MNAAQIAFRLSFEISPIIFTGGIAANIPGGMLPVLSIAQALSFADGLLGGSDFDIQNPFAHFSILPGGTLLDYKVGLYPFANQSVAANAVIKEPLTLSMLMKCPANSENGYSSKLAVISALQSSFDQHNQQGGTYTVATPSFIYTNLLLIRISDASDQESKQVQNAWKLDFLKPLVTLQDAQQAQNSMMSAITNGVQTDGSTSGIGQTVGVPQTLATPSIAPAASNTTGTGAAQAMGGPPQFQ